MSVTSENGAHRRLLRQVGDIPFRGIVCRSNERMDEIGPNSKNAQAGNQKIQVDLKEPTSCTSIPGSARRLPLTPLHTGDNLALAGTPPPATMEIMRHSDMRLTTKVYTAAGLLA